MSFFFLSLLRINLIMALSASFFILLKKQVVISIKREILNKSILKGELNPVFDFSC